MVLRLVTVVQVSLKAVVIRHVEELLQRSLDGWDGLHVLEIGAESLQLQRSPHQNLRNTSGVFAKLTENVSGGWVLLAGLLDSVATLPEDDLFKHCELATFLSLVGFQRVLPKHTEPYAAL